MSLYGALYAGVAGLSAQSNKLGIISDNIANVNTVGYKQTTANFQALVTSSGGAATYTPGGVLGNSEALVTTQGLLQTTTSGTDIAVSGQGFFVVNQKPDQSGQLLYTRAGSFTQDAKGDFVNSAGFFLQAWPLDRNGLLPGEPGNVNTESNANLSSLRTVNVQNLAGTAAATSLISIGANLKSSQTVLTGAGATAKLDLLDSLNSPLKGSAIIVPTAVDKIVKGDTLNISTGVNTSGFNYVYGGFTYGRDVTNGATLGDGENAKDLKTNATPLTPPVVTLGTAALPALAAGSLKTGASVAGATPIIVTASTTNLKTGDYVNITGESSALDGIPAFEINGSQQITVIDATHFSYVTPGTASVGNVSGGTVGDLVTPQPFYIGAAVTGNTPVTISQAPPANIAVGDWVTLAGVTSPVDGITLNGTFQVTVLNDANHFTVNSLGTPTVPPTATLNTTVQTQPINSMQTGPSVAGATVITVTADTTNLRNGDYITIAGDAGFDGITAPQINGAHQITVTGPTSFTFVSTGTATVGSTTGGTINDTVTPNPFKTGTSVAGNTLVTVSQPLPANAKVGTFVTFAGVNGAVDGLTLNGSFQITSITNANHYVINSLGTATLGNVAGGTTLTALTAKLTTGGSQAGGLGTITSERAPISTTLNSPTVSIYEPAHGLVTGDVVTMSSIPAGGIGGLTQAQLTGTFIVTVVDINHYTITAAANATSSAGGGIASVATARPYVGNIFDAQNASQSFFGVTGISGIDPNALSFNITTSATGTVKFTYTSTSPNASPGQFNNLNNLADAINNTVGLTARVVNSRIYVGASDATQAVTFTNNQTVATTGTGGVVQGGVDWTRELGVQSYALGANRFNSLSSLGQLVSLSSGITSNLENPLGASDLKINVVDPTDTISFKDGALNTGSLLAQLGIGASLNGGAFVAESVGPAGPAYNPQVATTNMASGAISPQFSRPVSIFDGLGTSHNLNVAFAKLQNNTWAVEVYAQPATNITPASASLINGQIATGTIRFNGDGSLQSVSASLTNPININWTNGSTPSNVSFDWGTQGLPFGTVGAASIGKTDGLSQFDSGYNVSFVNQNGSPVGQLTGISIDANGFITAAYNNGETQKLYKIPLASFTDPNRLQGASGDAYSQSNGSGIANLKQAGASGVGSISPGALETSNVELASQLTDMIVAQRAYQANTKVIQTADNLLQSLDQIIQ